MDETGFIKKQNSLKVVVLKGSSNVLSKSAGAIFHMCVCSGLRTRMACPNYGVARIGTGVLQPGFQPWTVANPALDSRCPTLII